MTLLRRTAAVLLTIGTLSAEAQTTYINPDGGTENERCLVGVGGVCQGGAYDGAFSIIRALEMDMGASLVRVDDAIDQIWQAVVDGGDLRARARYAADNLRLGYDAGAGYVERIDSIPASQVRVTNTSLFTGAQSNNYSDSFTTVGGWTSLNLTAGTLFAFVLSDTTVTNRWTSNNGGTGVGSTSYANSGNRDDHMVAFRASPTRYIIAWEDRPLSGADLDYNDLVLEVNWVAPVPLPAALPLLLSGLVGFAGLARARRRVLA